MIKTITHNAINLFLLIFLIGFNSSVKATEYTITSAAELTALSLEAGDVVTMQNGTWTNQKIVLKGTGTESEPITLKAETAGQVILNGTSRLQMYGEYLVVEGLTFYRGKLTSGHVIEFRTNSSSLASNCRLTNTKIKDYNPASDGTEYKWVSVYGKNNRVDHCEFTGKNHEGAMLVVWLDRTSNPTPNHHRIDHNYFGGIPEFSGGNGAEAIRIGTSDYSMQDSRTIVENNLFEECDGEIEIISNKSCFNIYRNNTFRKSAGSLTLRHGNDCEVYGNFFFGAFKKDCGGIRVIGENHKVYNNYLEGLINDGFRAPISIVNGVPDSPLNRYFQVKNAEIVNNTIVNCRYPFVIGAGANDELSLPPLNTKIANNITARYSGPTGDIIEYEATPIDITYQNNMFYGDDLGIEQPSGIEIADPELEQADDFFRPISTSSIIGYGSDISYLTADIDGQNRTIGNDAGCDQISEDTITNKPLDKTDVGVGWAEWLKEVSAAEGGTKLTEYINSANNGDLIVLTTSGGEYIIETGAVLNSHIEIIADKNLAVKPTITSSSSINEFIMLNNESSLTIQDINFKGGTLNNIFTAETQGSSIDSLKITNCDFSDISGSIVKAANTTVIGNLEVNNSRNFNVKAKAFSFESDAYPTQFKIENATYANIDNEIIDIVNSANSTITINHCTIDSAGLINDETPVFSFSDAVVNISNSIYSHCNISKPAFTFSGSNSLVDYCAFWETGTPTATNDAVLGEHNHNNVDPDFASRENLIFSLLPGSFALASGNDGENLGDLFWDVNNGQADNNALLEYIMVDESFIQDFDANTFSYNVSIVDSSNYSIEGSAQSTTAFVNTRYPINIPGQAVVEVIAENGINKKYYILNVSITSSVNENINNEPINVYPNPSNGELSVECELNGWISIYNTSGKLIRTIAATRGINKIDISTEVSGVYIMQYITANSVKFTNLIIE